jgi:hypothetical protein
MKKSLLLISIILLLVTLGCGGNGQIKGRVLDTGSSPVAGATITTSPGTYTATTDATGSYALSDVAAGNYTITATLGSASATAVASMQASAVSCTPPSVTAADITLNVSGGGGAVALPFSDDFETGDLSKWSTQNAGGGTIAVDAAAKLNGSYGLDCVDNSASQCMAYVERTIQSVNEVYYKINVKFASGYFAQLGASEDRIIAKVKATNSFIGIFTDNVGGVYTLRLQEGGAPYGNQNFSPVTEGTWYSVQVRAPVPSAGASIQWWVNGTPQTSLSADLSSYGTWDSLVVGLEYATVQTITQTAYFDDVSAAATQIP